jgi:FAD/FMN-containing dehydrogenase
MPLDPAERERVRDDLAEVVRGDVLFDDLNRALYSTDASLFQIEPLGVVAPADEADVQAVVRFAAERKLCLVPRGAGTGMAGEALGDGLVLDLSRHFRQIVEIGPDWVRVQPGVVLRTLNDALAKVGRRFAPDPASGESCTVGGMMANNASGARAVKHGYTRDHVLSCRVVLDSGDAVRAGREPLPPSPEHPERYRTILQESATLLRRHAGTIRASQPLTRFNRCGYLLTDVLGPDTLDLPRLLAGSEGTLGTFTELTLKTVPLPPGRGAALLSFPSLDAALQAVALAKSAGPVACELFDRRLVALTRSCSPDAAAAIPAAAEAVLLVEFEADSAAEARLFAETLLNRVHSKEHLSLSAFATADAEEVARMWQLRDAALPTLFGLGHGPKPVPFVEDVGVPPEALGQFLTRAQDILQTHELTASFMTHAAAGQVHIRPFLNPADPADAARLRPLADALYRVVLELGGTISTQHGTGIARTPWVERQYGPLYSVFRQLKQVFDPNGLFNPGKIVQTSGRDAWPMRKGFTFPALRGDPEVEGEPAANGATRLHWEPDELPQQVHACNGCGHCRAEAAPLRMCPVFRRSGNPTGQSQSPAPHPGRP